MRALLVQGRSPPTYWSYHYSLPFIGKAAALPPLGLATLAALLPRSWKLRIADLNVRAITDDEIRECDVVLVSGMLVQADSIREVLRRAARLSVRTVVGGPAATSSPEMFEEADHVFKGEAEGRLDLLVAALERPEKPAPRVLSPPDRQFSDMLTAPVPRFDILKLDDYASLAIQVSRGCPFRCEFCDIIEMFGRVPRLKSPEQVVAELEALFRLGARGPLFFVDDNFIGNRREVSALLPHVSAWQNAHGRPFDLFTEASLDLAGSPELVAAMIDAGFSAVFVGIESPSAQALREAGKHQNLRMAPNEAVGRLTAAGLEVFAGFIVGFDSDGPDIFDRQLDLISSIPVPRAMVGLLTALPGTALWRRLRDEGRLRELVNGNQFGRPNFEPAMDELRLLRGYRRLLASLYSAEAYYRRCRLFLDRWAAKSSPLRRGSLAALLRIVAGIGVFGPRRSHFWRLLAHELPKGLDTLARAVSLACLGEHFIRYTAEVVLPALDEMIAALERTTARSPSRHSLMDGEDRSSPSHGLAPSIDAEVSPVPSSPPA